MSSKTKPTKQERLGTLIQDARLLMGWTRIELAAAMGIAARAPAEIERGECTVRRLHLLAVECLLRRNDHYLAADRFRRKAEEIENAE